MSNAIKELHKYLAESPSVVYPEDVLAYLPAIEDENAKLRELCKAWYKFAYELFDDFIGEPEMSDDFMELDDRMRELWVEVDW